MGHNIISTYQNCNTDHTGVAIVLGFAAFFAIIATVMELIEIWKEKHE